MARATTSPTRPASGGISFRERFTQMGERANRRLSGFLLNLGDLILNTAPTGAGTFAGGDHARWPIVLGVGAASGVGLTVLLFLGGCGAHG